MANYTIVGIDNRLLMHLFQTDIHNNITKPFIINQTQTGGHDSSVFPLTQYAILLYCWR